ncbi:MAG: PorT family protein [Taibaiella sp.]|nr:PorT family protein [Taibaiella sp.]
MKKVLFIITAALIGNQAAQAQMSIAPEVGLNMSKFIGDDVYDDAKFKTGFKVGANVNFPVANNFYIAPGLFYSTKGVKYEETTLGITGKYNVNVGYLELPVNALYRLPLGDAGALMFSAGPYIGYALHGKSKAEITGIGSTEEDIVFGGDADEMNPLDIGFNAGVGYETPFGIYVRAQYGHGFTSLSNVDNITTNNQNLQFSLGYNLWTYNR